jgi:hypothetical protein
MRKNTLSRLACSVLATLALAMVMVADGAKPAAATTKVEAIRLCQQLPGRCKINAVSVGNPDIQICVRSNAGCEHWIHCPGKGQCYKVERDAPTTTGPKAPPITRIIQKDTDPKSTPKGGIVTLTRATQPTSGPKPVPPSTGPTVPVPPKPPVVQAGVTSPPIVPTGYVSVGGGKTYGVDPQRRK